MHVVSELGLCHTLPEIEITNIWLSNAVKTILPQSDRYVYNEPAISLKVMTYDIDFDIIKPKILTRAGASTEHTSTSTGKSVLE